MYLLLAFVVLISREIVRLRRWRRLASAQVNGAFHSVEKSCVILLITNHVFAGNFAPSKKIAFLFKSPVLGSEENTRWPTYHGAAQRPEPPEENQDEQQHQDQQSDGYEGPVRLHRRQKTLTELTSLTSEAFCYLVYFFHFNGNYILVKQCSILTVTRVSWKYGTKIMDLAGLVYLAPTHHSFVMTTQRYTELISALTYPKS